MADDSPDAEAVESAEVEESDRSAAETAEPKGEVEAQGASAEDDESRAPWSHRRLGALVGLAVVVVLAGLTGWLGYEAYQSHRTEQQREMFLDAGREAALRLTNVGWETADVDVQRVLDSATGKFYDDFQKRADSYLEVVKQVKSKSEGTITGLALEPVSDGEAKVLASVTIKSTNAGVPEQAPQYWRMLLTVQKNDGLAKVSEVEFVE
ncbi:Mce protein [Mycolicibacterium sp. XJ870]